MKRVNKDRLVNICLLLIGLVGLTFNIISNINKNKVNSEYEKPDKVSKEQFAMYIEGDAGNYVEYDSNTFPSGYILNKDNSQCIDINNNIVYGALSNVDNSVTVTTNKTVFCYLYFDMPITMVKYLLDEDTRPSSLWTSTLDGDGYRFVGGNADTALCLYNNGDHIETLANSSDSCPVLYFEVITNPVTGAVSVRYGLKCLTGSCSSVSGVKVLPEPDNYICFGTTDKNTCVENTDLYMYRIIGVFQDTDGNNHLKLIKKEAMNTAYKWHNLAGIFNWADSDLYSGINGGYFLNNAEYPYMQNPDWIDLIKEWTWSAVNTTISGPDYSTLDASEVYYHEMNHANKTNAVGEWTTPSAKVGLMYASDYMLSLGEGTLGTKRSWMYIVNNDTERLSTTGAAAPSAFEWTIASYGNAGSGFYTAWSISNAIITVQTRWQPYSVRPVFYLNGRILYESGTGTASDPFVLGELLLET